MNSSKSKILSEKIIAAVAVEDQHIFLTFARGVEFSEQPFDSKNAKLFFKYETISEPRIIQRDKNTYDESGSGEYFFSKILIPIVSDFIDEFGGVVPDILGISTFGTIEPARNFIQFTPGHGPNLGKIEKIDLTNELRSKGTRIVVDNDATAAAFGEYVFGAGAKHSTFAYVQAGRGLNAGIIFNGKPLRGRLNPEIGHLTASRYSRDSIPDPHLGNCGSHRACLNGLGGLRALRERMNEHNWTEDRGVDAMSYYIAQLCAAVTLMMSPDRIVVGGQSTRLHFREHLFQKIRYYYKDIVRGYPGYDDDRISRNIIIQAKLGDQAALLGILEIARRSILPLHELRVK
ncbi:putative NBD/HSP70 family sugar kinase [Azospirillum fermentarium]|uniref:ROK family protein n=1 Tax=Azospirillum fermentarium TaxID=1233114 RepID=UPI002225EDB5|nr:ROK family protein [Azospirillum fermentarium]MCW2248064.1 putative NBD/HSP70 family sugar kinase [Azospirillum fermentarium]